MPSFTCLSRHSFDESMHAWSCYSSLCIFPRRLTFATEATRSISSRAFIARRSMISFPSPGERAWCNWVNAYNGSSLFVNVKYCFIWEWIFALYTHTHIYIYIRNRSNANSISLKNPLLKSILSPFTRELNILVAQFGYFSTRWVISFFFSQRVATSLPGETRNRAVWHASVPLDLYSRRVTRGIWFIFVT